MVNWLGYTGRDKCALAWNGPWIELQFTLIYSVDEWKPVFVPSPSGPARVRINCRRYGFNGIKLGAKMLANSGWRCEQWRGAAPKGDEALTCQSGKFKPNSSHLEELCTLSCIYVFMITPTRLPCPPTQSTLWMHNGARPLSVAPIWNVECKYGILI